MKKKFFIRCFAVFHIIFLISCASFNKSHTTHYVAQQQAIAQGGIDKVILSLEKKAKHGGRDSLLFSFQAGYLHFFNKNYEKSKELFSMALDKINNYETRAKVNARGIGSNIKASFGSDMELPYKGEIFEKIMVNTFQALNYLFLNDIEDSNVEIRRADLRQKEAIEKHQKDLKKIEKEKESNSVASVLKNYDILDEYSSKVINSFQNGFTYYLSGLVYEINNETNDAYIDYKKSFNLYKNRCVLQKLIELSNKLNMKDELGNWKKLSLDIFKEDPSQILDKSDKDIGELVVISFTGNVPKKIQTKFSLWTTLRSFNVAFPFYDKNTFFSENSFLSVFFNGDDLGKTETVIDFIPVVVKNLKEKMPGIIARQAIRLVAKNTAESQARKRAGLLGGLLVKVVNKITERADLRGWYELPANIQVFRTKIPAGNNSIKIKSFSGNYENFSENIDVNINNGGYAIILVQTFGSQRSVHKITF